MSDSTPFVYGFCAGFFFAELLLVWIFRALPPKPPNVPSESAERWTYTVIDDGEIFVGDAPKDDFDSSTIAIRVANRLHTHPEAWN